jgi:2-polyprenyl-3-methyl-5-hydroxy-6-metoxy-1,4-benzoquinol methylase
MRGTIDFVKWREDTCPDDYRRFKKYGNLAQGKSVLDFGCGNGGFLELLKGEEGRIGVDLDLEAVTQIRESGIECHSSISTLPDEKFDIIFMFHVIEHLSNPEEMLVNLFEHITDGGRIVIETPNADDALLSIYKCKAFADFTYWSPHIYLYNENTLTKMIQNAGCDVIDMAQEQRYSLANHLRWLSQGLPCGGVKEYQSLNVAELNEVYANVLASQKACDTIACMIGEGGG